MPLFIEPGGRKYTGSADSFIGKLWDECFNREMLDTPDNPKTSVV
jgi:hypothetical protein